MQKKKPPKVQPADFDELFARGMALSGESETTAGPPAARPHQPALPPVEQPGLGYAEKVNQKIPILFQYFYLHCAG